MSERTGINRRVDLDDDIDIGEVEPSRRNVRAEQDARRRRREGGEGCVGRRATGWRLLPVQRVEGEAGFDDRGQGRERLKEVVDGRAGREVDDELACAGRVIKVCGGERFLTEDSEEQSNALGGRADDEAVLQAGQPQCQPKLEIRVE